MIMDTKDRTRRRKEAEQLANSRLIDVHLWSDFPEINATVDHIWTLVGRSESKNITKRHIKVTPFQRILKI